MNRVTADGSRTGVARPEYELLVTGVGFEPERAGGIDARELLQRDGAVVLSGYPAYPDSLVLAAAEILGTRLQRLFTVRRAGAEHADRIALHTDGFNVVVDVHGQPRRLRDPDEDYVLIQCARRADCGGASLVADAYRLLDRLRDDQPELWDFLTTAEVDYFGSWGDMPAVPRTPWICRHVEYTRAGRCVVRANDGAQPAAHENRCDAHEEMLDRYADIRATLAASAPRVELQEGEILVVDNYRCWHGRDAHETPRLVYIMTVKTVDAM
jgi:hypothetical protein